MSFYVQWQDNRAVSQTDFPTEPAAQFFAKQKRAAGIIHVVVFEVEDPA